MRLSPISRARSWKQSVKAKRSFSVKAALGHRLGKTEKQLRRTAKIFEKIAAGNEAGGAGGQTSYAALKRVDATWRDLREGNMTPPAVPFVEEKDQDLQTIEYDVIICGGTLGIFLACALQQKGLRVALIEKGPLMGREQEWNISRQELEELAQTGIMTMDEIESCIRSEWERVRTAFHKGSADPPCRLSFFAAASDERSVQCSDNFQEAGGVLLERRPIQSVEVHHNGIRVQLPDTEIPSPSATQLTGRLLVDCMGNFSPIVRQIRHGQHPDGVCVVVGTCARGFDINDYSDLINTHEPIATVGDTDQRVQYFWEAFPAGSGPRDRTTYMFAYLDATPGDPSLEDLFEAYWERLPLYQNVSFEDLSFLRALFGFFPAYKDSPLQPEFDRIIHVGDAGGLQSPLSFGGFGAMSRHLRRHINSISSALEIDAVDKESLGLINPYSPGLRCSWLFQTVMNAKEITPSNFINDTLSNNFSVMDRLGPSVMTPFLRDVTRFGPLTTTLIYQVASNPGFILAIVRLLGIPLLIDWIPHFLALGFYQLAFTTGRPIKRFMATLPPRDKYKWHRYLEAFEYGSGLDYNH